MTGPRRPGQGRTDINAQEQTQAIIEALESKKGERIAIFDMRGRSELTDAYVVVSGSSPPHLKALFNEVQHALKEKGVTCYRRSGDPECGWMVLDYVDVIIHIFLEDTRQYYAVETLWAQAPATATTPR